jgi:aspartyl-tRNA synthetase
MGQEDDIRQFIAFPKTKSATDPMTGAPLPAEQAALDTLGIRVAASTPAS